MVRSRTPWIPACAVTCAMLGTAVTVLGDDRGAVPGHDALVPGAEAPATPALVPGARVRIEAPSLQSKAFVGTVVDLEDDLLILEPDRSRWGRDHETIPRSKITRLQISVERRAHTGMGALIGLFVGAGGMAVSMVASGGPDGDGDLAAAAIGMGAAVGAGLGAFAGATMKTDRWQEVGRDGLQIGVGPTRGGGVGIRLRLALGRGH